MHTYERTTQSLVIKRMGLIENDAEIARFKGIRTIDPNESVEMNVVPTIEIAFSDGPLKNLIVLGLLNRIHTFVAKEVLIPLEGFF